jgi:hypothetical protein
MDIWLENHIEKHLTLKTKAILVTDKGEKLYHLDKDNERAPFNIEFDLFDIGEDAYNVLEIIL